MTQYDFISIIKNKVPLIMLFIQFTIVDIFYNDCNKYENNIGFWIYYPSLCILCFSFEYYRAKQLYTRIYAHKTKNSIIFISILSSFLTLWTFFTVSNFIQNGHPYDCIFQYNLILPDVYFIVHGF